MTVQLLSIGTATPAQQLAQSDAAAAALACSCDNDNHRRLLPRLYQKAGVATRGCVLLRDPHDNLTQYYAEDSHAGPTMGQRMQQYEAHAPALALAAARNAIARACISPEEITQLVTVSCTGFAAPGIDVELIQGLGLADNVGRTHLGFMGCHGALNGLRIADALAQQQPQGCVLGVCVELCTLHFQYGWRPDRIVSNALFADGAAAFVARAQTTGEHWRLIDNHSVILPDTRDHMTWRIGDHGFEMYLSPQVPQLIRDDLRAAIAPWLAQHQLGVEDVKAWAIHPGGPRVLQAVEEALSLEENQAACSRAVLRECGNMSSATLLFILDRLRSQHASGPCVALAFGPGLTIEAALLD